MKRLALYAICPYFAMFPEKFVRDQVEEYSKPRDWIFDPFCGRGTTILESLLLGRNAAGVSRIGLERIKCGCYIIAEGEYVDEVIG